MQLLFCVAPLGRAQAQGQGAFGLPDPAQPLPPPDTSAVPPLPQQQPSTPQPSAPQPSFPQPSFPAVPSPPRPPAPTQFDMRQYLLGQWRGQITDQTGMWYVAVAFHPDGTFLQTRVRVDNGFQLTMIGSWTVRSSGQDGVVSSIITNWNPRMYCTPQGGCQPLNLPRNSSTSFHALDRNEIQTPLGLFQRAG